MWIDSINANAVWLAELLLKMRWVIITSDDPVFITSDNPVVFEHLSLKFKGLTDPDATILFPLSPTKLLCLDNKMTEPNFQYYSVRGDGAAQNLIIWRNSNEKMFTSRNPDEVCMDLVAFADKLDAQQSTA